MNECQPSQGVLNVCFFPEELKEKVGLGLGGIFPINARTCQLGEKYIPLSNR